MRPPKRPSPFDGNASSSDEDGVLARELGGASIGLQRPDSRGYKRAKW